MNIKSYTQHLLSIAVIVFFTVLGLGSTDNSTSSDNENITEESASKEPLDICRCLNEPGNSEYMIQNKVRCRDLISQELGVENHEKINMSRNPELSDKFDQIVLRCNGTLETGIELIDNNNQLIPHIGTTEGYVWESINYQAQTYTTLAFDGLIFRIAAYSMNNSTNSEDFSLVIKLSGTWKALDTNIAEGVYTDTDAKVLWTFSDNYETLVNEEGVEFKRVNIFQ